MTRFREGSPWSSWGTGSRRQHLEPSEKQLFNTKVLHINPLDAHRMHGGSPLPLNPCGMGLGYLKTPNWRFFFNFRWFYVWADDINTVELTGFNKQVKPRFTTNSRAAHKFLTIFFFLKNLVFLKNFDFFEKIWFFWKNLIFLKNFDFFEKFWFFWKI